MIEDEKICLCGGYWDWVREDLQSEWGPKPEKIPFELNDKSKINGWVWEYICFNCQDKGVTFENLISNSNQKINSLITNYFPGAGVSSSSSCPVVCKTCPSFPSGPCGTKKVTLGPPACEDCNGRGSGTITCDVPVPYSECSSSSSSSSSTKHCVLCGAAAGSPHNYSCAFRNYTDRNDPCYE
jgi:hypothetical protein